MSEVDCFLLHVLDFLFLVPLALRLQMGVVPTLVEDKLVPVQLVLQVVRPLVRV